MICVKIMKKIPSDKLKNAKNNNSRKNQQNL